MRTNHGRMGRNAAICVIVHVVTPQEHGNCLNNMELNGAPGEIRTPDLLIRSQSLYPAELRAHICELQSEAAWNEPFTEYQD